MIERLAHDLHGSFPDMRGFSKRNLQYRCAVAEDLLDKSIVQQAVEQLPWGHSLGFFTKGGAGSATYYQLNQEKIDKLVVDRTHLDTNAGDLKLATKFAKNDKRPVGKT